ncbi:MAG: lamin tail domain-containing protein [Myxococcales bacterium]|nr:lamin tail domain-containing protein [Myxococcales bacterium]
MLRANGRARAVLALGLMVSLFAACSLAVDLDGYSGGTADTGGRDSGTIDARDASTDTLVADGPVDSKPDTTVADVDATADSAVDSSTVDTAADSGSDVAIDSAPDGDAAPGCHPIINEVVTGLALPGSATDEFVELYNPCPAAIPLSTWKIAYRSSAGASESTLAALTGTIPAGGYLFLASTGGYFSKAPYTPDATFSSGMAGAGGGIGLRDDKGALVDSLAWGDAAAGHPFAETAKKAAATTSAPPGQGLARTPNGKDTNDNSADFAAATPTPKAAN